MGKGKYILACVNGLPPSEAVCDYSSWLAKSLGKTLKLFHSIDHQPADSVSDLSGSIGLGARDELLEELVAVEHEQNRLLQKKAKLLLEAAKDRAQHNGIAEPKICLRQGDFLENLVDLREDLEMVVIGRYGKNHQDPSETAVGHRVEKVIRALELPILVVGQAFAEPKRILLAYDGSAASVKGLEYLISRGAFQRLEIHVVYVGKESERSTAFLSEAVKKLEASDRSVKCEHLAGEAGDAIQSYISQHSVDLTLMGAFGHHWVRNLLVGSFTSSMLAISKTPLLLVR